jgi:hypothetical protein
VRVDGSLGLDSRHSGPASTSVASTTAARRAASDLSRGDTGCAGQGEDLDDV